MSTAEATATLDLDPRASALEDYIRSGRALRLTPDARRWTLRLRLLTPVSHHDPARVDKSNRTLFLRQRQLVDIGQTGRMPTQEEVDRACALLPVPADAADLFAEVSFEQFVGAALLREFIAAYGAGDGTGLFSGMERYRRLEERAAQSAVQAATLFEFWGLLCGSLQAGAPDHEESVSLARLLALPSTIGSRVLRTLSDHTRPCAMLARLWADQAKLQSSAYAKRAGVEQGSAGSTVLDFDADWLRASPGTTVPLDVPAFSANSLRHELVREPGMWHLFHALGLPMDEPPTSASAIFYNGGDLKEGASQPSAAFWLRQEARRRYPILSLVSGATNEMTLGEGDLAVHCWLRCRENNDAIEAAGIRGMRTELSAFDLLDEEVRTRHANGRVDNSPQPFGFETLIQGSEILVQFSLRPYARDLEVGALMAALATYENADATIGGQSARGFGRIEMAYHDCGPDEAARQLYEDYLAEHREALRAGIADGTLGTGRVMLT